MTEGPWKDAESVELEDRVVDRIVSTVVERGPGLARRGRRIDRAKRVGAIAAVAGAAALTVVLTSSPSPVVPTTPLACATWRPARGLDLGVRGVAKAEGSVRLLEAEPCRTVLEVRRGRVTILARDLGGGSLVVRAGPDEVVVRGTLFAVERTGDETIVSTAEGVVEITDRARVSAGSRARVTTDRVDRSDLLAEEADDLRIAVGERAESAPTVEPTPEQVVTSEPIPKTERRRKRTKRRTRERMSAIDLVRRAHDARKAGDLERARVFFRDAGSRPGTTAEAAWLALARMELSAGQPRAAGAALRERARRFARGTLELEAAWLQVRVLDESRDVAGARERARRLIRRWPNSAQAEKAKRFLDGE